MQRLRFPFFVTLLTGLIATWGASTAHADLDGLFRRLPSEANALVVFKVDEILKTPLAVQQKWADNLDEGADILFYGCDLAASESGQRLMESIGALTGADVAASDDLTGHTQLGGDWELEYGNGEIETGVIFSPEIQQTWRGALATSTVNSNADTIDVNLGDTVAEDEALITLESDKASMEIPAPLAGTVRELAVSVGDNVAQGDLILMLETAADTSDEAAPATAPTPAATPSSEPSTAQAGIRSYQGEADARCEVLVLGAGPGGYTAAFRAADLGKQVI